MAKRLERLAILFGVGVVAVSFFSGVGQAHQSMADQLWVIQEALHYMGQCP